jgi:hypothetical protein
MSDEEEIEIYCKGEACGDCRMICPLDKIAHKPDSTTAGPSGRASGCSPLGVEQPLDSTRFTAWPVARPMDSSKDKGGAIIGCEGCTKRYEFQGCGECVGD